MRFSHFDGKIIRDPETKEKLVDGDHYLGTMIIRVKNGYLDGGDDCAIETLDGYREYRQGSLLHRVGKAAVVDLSDRSKDEFWENGKRLN